MQDIQKNNRLRKRNTALFLAIPFFASLLSLVIFSMTMYPHPFYGARAIKFIQHAILPFPPFMPAGWGPSFNNGTVFMVHILVSVRLWVLGAAWALGGAWVYRRPERCASACAIFTALLILSDFLLSALSRHTLYPAWRELVLYIVMFLGSVPLICKAIRNR